MKYLAGLLAAFLLVPVFPAAAADGVDTSPLPLVAAPAFPKWRPRRPVAITHANDGSNRLFVLSEYGQVLFVPNRQDVTEEDAKTFLDIEEKVDYMDRENEEGLLGLVFHPKYKENGQFFLYYTSRVPAHTSVISRFKVSKDDPNKADPASEEVLLTIPQPRWNHNGGNLAFGPDGYLYIGLGDGGGANNEFKNAQKLTTHLSSMLRIDVDRKDPGKNYAIPADNPFVKTEGAKPEIFAYGFRNIWGMSFDPETKLLWVGDVGQDIWEEIDIVVKGGNYGWDIREGLHKFDARNSKPGPGRMPDLQNKPDPNDRTDLIDPIWEYHHGTQPKSFADGEGKSITGGVVYRGKRLPELVGHYVYADYVSGKIWGLKYDEKAKKVVANRPIAGPMATIPCMTIGTDQNGEIYLGDSFNKLWWLEAKK